MAEDAPTYSIDSSALIHGWVRAYPPEIFPPLWQRFDELIQSGRMLICEDVLLELKTKEDELYAWCKARPQMIVDVDDAVQNEMMLIMGNYPKLVDTAKGKSGADPFVIALAKAQNGLTVVTEEKGGSAKKPKIPYVCRQEGIRVIDLLELIKEQGWIIG